MNIIFTAYLLAAFVAIGAGAPQLKKLIVTKRSDEFSLPTWIIWMLAQVVQLVYALSVNDKLYALVGAMWLSFYVLIVGLIIRYRRPAAVPIEETTIL